MIKNLELNEQKLRDLYLRDLSLGKIQGPPAGYASIDKPWLKYYNEESITSDLPEMTAFEYLYECNKNYKERIALSYFERKITFNELFNNIIITAYAFKNMGIKKGDIVSISMPNIPEAVYMFYALSLLGAVSNMIDPRTSTEGIEKYVKEANSELFVVIDVVLDKIKNIKNNTSVKNIIVVSPADSLPLALKLGYKTGNFIKQIKNKKSVDIKNLDYELWKEFYKRGKYYNEDVDSIKYIGIDNFPKFEKNRPLVIEHTGGTTGQPKGVVLTNENINAVAIQSVLTGIDMKREHNWLDIMPPFIAYGVGMGLHLPLTIGMETILIPQFNPKKFDELLIKHKPNHMVGVPSYWGTIIKSKKLQKSDLSYIIAPTVGGDAMETNLEIASNKFLKEHNCKYGITKGYGMTEVTGGVAGTIDQNNEIGSVGIPFVKTTISIFDPETQKELGYNENGEICITGPNTMLGYFKDKITTEEVLKTHKDGKVWVHSGDIGYMTKDGNIFVVDRIKRMIIRYDGFKVFPSHIEKVILKHPAIAECKVVGMPDLEHSQGKLPCAVVTLNENYTIDDFSQIEMELKQLCEQQLQEYALPQKFKLKDELPLTKIGKIYPLELEKEIEQEIKKQRKVRKLINKNIK